MRDKQRIDWNSTGGVGELGGVTGCEAVFRLYCMWKESMFNKRVKHTMYTINPFSFQTKVWNMCWIREGFQNSSLNPHTHLCFTYMYEFTYIYVSRSFSLRIPQEMQVCRNGRILIGQDLNSMYQRLFMKEQNPWEIYISRS